MKDLFQDLFCTLVGFLAYAVPILGFSAVLTYLLVMRGCLR